jgi:uncharacterized repeat protein (TIGR03803 family)
MRFKLLLRILVFSLISGTIQGCAAQRFTPDAAPSPDLQRVRPGSSSGYQYDTIFSFHGYDGAGSAAALIYYKGKLYGTTESGGAYARGTVFSVTPAGVENVIHSFGVSYDGSDPEAGLCVLNGVLYGTTFSGGAYDGGTVFSVMPDGTERVLYSFGKSGEAPANPTAGLTVLNGVLYGTTSSGGIYNNGTVFAITPAGQLTVLHKFNYGGYHKKDGDYPAAGLAAWNGDLYGTTESGGVNEQGIVFSITTAGTERVLYSFPARRFDGENPEAGLIVFDGLLYGTTSSGGTGFDDAGTVFSLTAKGREHLIFNFQPFKEYGFSADTALVPARGTFYGTMPEGGANSSGTLYSVTPSGSATLVHVFGSPPDGAKPLAGLTNVRGTLYGTTSIGGGVADSGTVYRLIVK